MMDGVGPRINNPGGGPRGTNGATVADNGRDSKTKLLARAECVECPAELCLPSDLCDDVRSVIGWLPKPLPVLVGRKSVDEREV